MNSQMNQKEPISNSKIALVPNTPNWLRSFQGCEHYTDEEAYQVIDGLKMLAGILLNMSQEVQQYLKPNNKAIA